MMSHFLPLFSGIVFISSSPPWSVLGDVAIRGQFITFTRFTCSGDVVCVMDTPDESFGAQSQAQCALECNRRRLPESQTCIGVNFRQESNVCETFSNVTDLTDFSKNVPGCQYVQIGSVDNLHCGFIFDVDECLNNNGGCSSSAVCTNTRGSFFCRCNVGCIGDGFVCTDINECLNISGGCSSHAHCINTMCSYQCSCNAGYQGNGFTCTSCAEWASSGGCTMGATSYGSGYSLAACQSLCYFMASCAQVDYNTDTSCWVHFGYNDWFPVLFQSCTKYSLTRLC